jgi:hypothetical protein
MDKGIVELGLADVGTEPIDVLEGAGSVKADTVGAEADDSAIFLVEAPELEVPVAFPGVVEHVGICELGEEWARVFGQRVEEEAVEG